MGGGPAQIDLEHFLALPEFVGALLFWKIQKYIILMVLKICKKNGKKIGKKCSMTAQSRGRGGSPKFNWPSRASITPSVTNYNPFSSSLNFSVTQPLYLFLLLSGNPSIYLEILPSIWQCCHLSGDVAIYLAMLPSIWQFCCLVLGAWHQSGSLV